MRKYFIATHPECKKRKVPKVGFLIPHAVLWNLLIVFCSNGQATDFPERNGIEFSPRLLDNMLLLNNFDLELPVEKQMLYKWAETGLARDPDAGFATLASNKYFQDYCKQKKIIHLGGPMLGNISETGAHVWLRTVKPGGVTVSVTLNGHSKTFGPIYSTLESELSVVVPIAGLTPNSEYSYRVFVDEVEIEVPQNSSIKTTSSESDKITRIAFGSCLHRWGFGNQKQANTMLTRNPNALLLLGDTAPQDKLNHKGWHSLDYLARDLYPAWRDLAAKVPVYATWDDHDYFGDDLWGEPKGYTKEDKDKVWQVFRTSWANPSYGFSEERKGVFFKTRIGAADVIMVDHRYFRTKNSFLGDEQMAWLEKQLLNCKGPFIILSCGTMWSDYVSGGKDSWGTFDRKAREQIFSLIEKNNISGVILISGDRHGARGFMIPRANGFKFYEFEAASLGGLGGPNISDPAWKTQLFGIGGKYAFGELSFDAAPADPTAAFRLVGEEGKILYELTLKKSELTPFNFSKR